MRGHLLVAFVLVAFGIGTVGAPAEPPAGPQPSDDVARDEAAREREARRDADTAEERRRRSASRRAFAGASRARAIGVAKDRHPDVVLQPAWRGPHLAPGQRIAEYLGDHAARLTGDAGGGRTLVASLLPMRAEDRDGRKRPVDLSLKETDGGLVPVNPLTDIRIPAHLADGVALPGTGVSIVPDVAASPAPSVVADTAFYPSALTDTDVIVKPTPGGFAIHLQVRSEDAPERFRLRIDAPQDRELRLSDDRDAVLVERDGEAAVSIGMPRVWDADHRPVDAHWRLDGRALVIDVPHRAHDGAYPYLVDPFVDKAAADWFDWEASGNHDFAGWRHWGSSGKYYGPYEGPGYLGTGLYMRLLDWNATSPIYYWNNDTGTYFFKAQGTAEVYRAEWNMLTQDYSQDTCVYTAIRRKSGTDANPTVHWDPALFENGPTENCSVFYDIYHGSCNGCTPGWSSPGNYAVFGVRMNTSRNRWYWVVHLGRSYVYLFDDSEPQVAHNGPKNSGTSDWGDWPATTAVDASFSDAGLGIKRARLSAPGWTGGVLVEQGQESWKAGAADWCERIATCPPSFRSTGNSDATRNATVKDMPAGNNTVALEAVDPADNTTPTQSFRVKVDRDAPQISFSGPPKDNKFVRPGAVLTIHAKDGSGTPDSAQRSGAEHMDYEVQREGEPAPMVDPPGEPPSDIPSCPQSSCAINHPVPFDVDDGTYRVRARAYDQIGPTHTSPWSEHTVNVDSAPPEVQTSGTLRDQVASITGGDYDLRVDAQDGSASAPRSGVKRITISMRRPGATAFETVRTREQACPDGSCPMRLDWIWRTDRFGDGTYRFRVQAWDQLDQATTPEEWDVTLAPRPLQPHVGNGLEDFWTYESVPTGAGGGAHVNLGNGNFVWHAMPMSNPGRGLSTIVNLTYSAHARPTDVGFSAPLGPGFSMGISSLTRINERLGVTFPADGTPITLYDADGTRHVFHPGDDGSDADLMPDHYIPPAGVNIHLRRFAPYLPPDSAPVANPRAWAATRPDGVTHFFNEFGVQRYVEDRNGNKIQFDYEIVLPDTGLADTCDVTELDPGNLGSCVLRLKSVKDSAGTVSGKPGRTFVLNYWTQAEEQDHESTDGGDGDDDPGPEAGKLRNITDHGGRVVAFRYDSIGKLTRMTEAVGTPVERNTHFEWSPDGTGSKVWRVQDPRGARTKIAYEPAADDDPLGSVRRVAGITDRRGARRQFVYGMRSGAAGTSTTVHAPRAFEGLSETAPPRANFDSVYQFDPRGRVEEAQDAHDVKSTFQWDDDNNLVRMVDADSVDADEAVTQMAYDDNGQLTDVTDPEGHITQLRYREGSGVAALRTGINDGNGQSNDADERFVSDLERVTAPRGVETGTDGDYTTRFVLDAAGLVRERWESGEATPMKFDYTGFGELKAIETELGHKRTYEQFDDNGMPEVEVDERGNATSGNVNDGRWVSDYDAVGNLLAVTDPRGFGLGGPSNRSAPYTSSWTYDGHNRPLTEKQSKRSDLSPVVFINRSFGYDLNDNRTRLTDGVGAEWLTSYTAMDEPEKEESPPVAHAAPDATPTREVTRTFYDHAGNVVRLERPKGAGTASTVDFVTDYVYDNLDRLVVEAPRSSADRHTERLTSYGYDARGNVRRLADPRGNATSFAAGDTFDQKVAKARANVDEASPSFAETRLRARLTYDRADRLREQVEAPGRAGLSLKTTFDYDANDNVSASVAPRGHAEGRPEAFETEFAYDERDQRTDVYDPHDNRTHTKYRIDGLVEKVTTPKGVADDASRDRDAPYWETSYGYDAAGDLIEQSVPRAPGQHGPANPRWRFVRNAVGDPIQIVDPRGHDEGTLRARYTFTNEFLDTGQLRTTQRPSFWGFEAGGEPEVRPRPLGSLGNRGDSSAKPAAGVSGDFGEVEPENIPGVLPKAGAVTLGYDDEFRLLSVREDVTGTTANCSDPNLDIGNAPNACVRLARDAMGRLTRVERSLDRGAADLNHRTILERLAYDRNGNVAEQIDGEGRGTLFGYDQYDQLLTENRPGSGADAREITTQTYDVNGNVERIDFPRAGTNLRRTFDDADRVLSERNGMTYKYDLQRQRRTIDGERTTYGYDPNGNVTTIRSPRGHDDPLVNETTTAQCDVAASSGVRTTAYERSCFETVRVFDELDQMTEHRDGFRNTTKLWYDRNGNNWRVEAPGGAAAPGGSEQRVLTVREFDGRDLPWRETVGTGTHARTTITEFDPIGNLRRVVKPAGVNETTWRPIHNDTRELPSAHDSAADRADTALRDAARHATVYEYSVDNILTAKHVPWAPGDRANDQTPGTEEPRYRVDFGLDARGNVKSTSSPWDWANAQSERLVATYDHLDTGWISDAQDPTFAHEDGSRGGGQRFDYVYDRRGLQQRWRALSRDGSTVRRLMTRDYHPSGLMSRRTGRRSENDPTRIVYTYTYDANRNLAGMIDHRNDDGQGSNAGADADDRQTTLDYDAADRELRVHDVRPSRTHDTVSVRDADGNVIRRRTDGTGADAESYSAAGKDSRYWFDPLGREIRTEIQRTGSPTRTWNTQFYGSGQRAKRTKARESMSFQDEWFYADDGRLVTARRGSASAPTTRKNQTYEYDDNGNRKRDERGTYAFNGRDQVIRWVRGGRARNPDTSVEYWVDGLGRITKKVDGAPPEDGGGTVTSDYDGYELDYSDLQTSTLGKWRTNYTHGAATGVVQEIDFRRLDGASTPETTTYRHDDFDRLTGVRRNTDSAPSGVYPRQFEYDALDRRERRCTGATGDECAGARRIDLTHVGLSERLAAERPTDGSNADTRDYDYGSSGEPLGSQMWLPDESRFGYRSYGLDANGSVEVLERGDGSWFEGSVGGGQFKTDRYDYDPYGRLEAWSGQKQGDGFLDGEAGLTGNAASNPIRFQGFYYDAAFEGYDMHARAYRPDAAQFLSLDRYESARGDFELQADPLTNNRYAFAGNNPVNNIEFDGHRFEGGGGIGGPRTDEGRPTTRENASESPGSKPVVVSTTNTHSWRERIAQQKQAEYEAEVAHLRRAHRAGVPKHVPQKVLGPDDPVPGEVVYHGTQAHIELDRYREIEGKLRSQFAATCGTIIHHPSLTKEGKVACDLQPTGEPITDYANTFDVAIFALTLGRRPGAGSGRGAPVPRRSGGRTGPSRIKENARHGLNAEKRIARSHPGSRARATLQARSGTRVVDVLTPQGLSIESKVGRTSLTKDTRRQIQRDLELLRDPNSPVKSLEWRFSTSPRTGQIGPTAPLERALKKAGIKIRYDP